MTQLRYLIATFMTKQAVAIPSVKREDGQTLAEYALILALIAAVVAVVVAALGGQISTLFGSIGSSL
jgi:pilus assembly protein Flp/PilA